MKRAGLLIILVFFLFITLTHIVAEHSEKECFLLKNEKHFHQDPFSKYCNFCLNISFFIVFLNLIYLFILLFFEKNLKFSFLKQNFLTYLKVRAPPQKI